MAATTYDMDYWDLNGEPITREEWAEIGDAWEERSENDSVTGVARWNGFSARFAQRGELIDHGPFLVTAHRKTDGRLVFHRRAANRDDAIGLLAEAVK